jgi:O-antigen ligase
MNTGITENKNALGADCLILGFFLFWHLLRTWRSKRTRQRRRELWLVAGLSYGVYWLLSEASSATATISLLIGMAVVVFVGLRSVNKNLIGTYLLVGLVLFFIAEMAFGLSVAVSQSMGRGSGFSGRTILWSALLNGGTNPIFGTGYESFWVGQRPEQLLTGVFFFIPNEAHNGYLEIYLTLGLIGLFLLIGMFLAAFWKIRRQLFRNFDWARYCLGFFAAIVVYNWTEAGFKTIAPMSFMFYLIAIDYRPPRRATGQVSVERSQESRQFAYA